ncbi:SDR family oxidoreductase [Alcaligenaceae bacterium]|nr:SDR family oxidoreductase [Alcaligenaceae bacterium]
MKTITPPPPQQGRTALVTGARRGIGFSIAERLHKDGANVVLLDIDPAETQAAAMKLGSEEGRVMALAADVSDRQAVDEAVRQIMARFGGIDILVNNAGISPKHDGKSATVASMDAEEWQRVISINLTGTFFCSQACLASMKSRKWGRIINMSSQAGRTASTIAGAHYAASKAGILAFSRALAAETGPDGITVNCIAPGRIITPMAAEAGEEANAQYLKRIPVNRLGQPRDISSTVSFLASDDAGFITGATIDVNGGAFMS